jgi:hypothetical protein
LFELDTSIPYEHAGGTRALDSGQISRTVLRSSLATTLEIFTADVGTSDSVSMMKVRLLIGVEKRGIKELRDT